MKKICALALAVVGLTLSSCRMGNFVSQVLATSTPSPTETVLPTKTPRPIFTLTATTTTTAEPTRTTTLTPRPKTPTRRPPATKTATPQASPIPKSAYAYRFFPGTCPPYPDPDGPCRSPKGVVCHHSGGKEIRVVVYSNHTDAGSLQAGARVAMSSAPDGAWIDPVEISEGDGLAHKTLATEFDPPSKNDGIYYAWVIDGQGRRISEMSPPIVLTSSPPEKPDFCSVAALIFADGF